MAAKLSIQKSDWTEVRSLRAPPQEVIDILGITVMLITGAKKLPDWTFIMKHLMDSMFLDTVRNLEVDKISPATMSAAKAAFEGVCDADVLKSKSCASVSFHHWVKAILESS